MEPRKQSPDQIFEEALQLSDPEKRAAYLKKVTGGDEQLLRRIEALLRAHEGAGEFLAESPMGVSAKTLLVSSSAMEVVTEKSGDRIGRYKLLQQIGEGGCGVVYMAEQEEPVRRRVALKVIKLGMDTKQVVGRFEAERQALALMDHPNIAKVLDAGATETGRPYFVMELVRGIKITDYCDQNNLTTEERLNLFVQVCHAIQHAHQKGIIHRDIKPSNVLVTLHDGVPVPKVIDFGIAKATTDQRLTDKTIFTAFEQFIGTPAYMSPEQAEMSGLDIDTRSDIYSLGVLLYELLTGRTPFDPTTLLKAGLDEMRRTIREEEPPKPSTRLSTVSGADLDAIAKHRKTQPPQLKSLIRGDLDWIVMKALEKDRTRRFETVNALANDVKRYLVNEPVLACPPSYFYRLQKLVLRNKLAFGAAVSVFSALFVGLAFSTLLFIRERKAHRQIQIVLSQQRILRDEAEQQRLGAEKQRNKAEVQSRVAEKERVRADEEARAARDSVERIKIQRANDFFKADEPALALALLAQVLRQNPSNEFATQRIMSALTQRNFLLPRFPVAGSNYLANFSPDGQRLATVSTDRQLTIFDSFVGNVVAGPVSVSGRVKALKFSPDGVQLLTQSSNQVVIWDSSSLKRVRESPVFSTNIFSAHFTPLGIRLIRIENAAVSVLALDGTVLIGPLAGDGGSMDVVSFTTDGTRLATVDLNSGVRIWNTVNGEAMTERLDAGASAPRFALSPDGNYFAVGCLGSFQACLGNIGVTPPKLTFLDHRSTVRTVQFSPDGASFVTGASDGTIRIWETITGRLLNDSIRYRGAVSALQFDASGKRLLASSDDHTLRVWNVVNSQPISEAFHFGGRLNQIKMSQDGASLLLVSPTGAEIWDLRQGRALAETRREGNEDGRVILSPDGGTEIRLEGMENDSATLARIVDHDTRRSSFKSLLFDAPILSACFSPDSERFVLCIGSGAADVRGRAEVFDTKTGVKLMELKNEPTSLFDWAVNIAEFSGNGKFIATGSRSNVRIWNAKNGQPLTDPLEIGRDVYNLTFSPDSLSLLGFGEECQMAVLWSVSGAKLHEFKHDSTVSCAAFSPDGKLCVTGGADCAARLWDPKTGTLLHDLRNKSAVVRATFSPDCKLLAVGLENGSIQVWDVNIGQEIMDPIDCPIPQQRTYFQSLKFADDGSEIIVGFHQSNRDWDISATPVFVSKLPVPKASVPAPSWFIDLAEAVGGLRLTDVGPLLSRSISGISRIRTAAQGTLEADTALYTRWANWFFADRGTRPIAPIAKLSTRDFLEIFSKARNPEVFDLNAAEALVGVQSTLSDGISNASVRIQQIKHAYALHEQAWALKRGGQLKQAESAYRQALALRQQLFGKEDGEAADIAFDLAYMLHHDQQQFEKAEALYTEAIAIRKKVLGPDHYSVAEALNELALCLEAGGKFPEAETALREVLNIKLGFPEHIADCPYQYWNTVLVSKLVSLLRKQGKQVELEAFCAEFLARPNKDWLNDIAWQFATSRDSELRDGARAVTLATKSVELTKRKDAATLDTLAAAYAEVGRFADSVLVEQEALSLLKDSRDKDDYLSRLKLYRSNLAYRQRN